MIPQVEPWISDEEKKQLMEAIDSTWVTEHKKTEAFESQFKSLVNTNHALTYCNGTLTLLAALKILEIGDNPQDEVIIPNMTFTATPNAIIYAGAKPVFIDINPKTLQIDTSKIEEKITSNTKAIMPVHLYGFSCDIENIQILAKKHNLKIIEDAAQSVGATFKDKNVGTFGEFGSFSFFGNKNMTTGEGGMLVTNSPVLAKQAYLFKNHGRSKRGTFIHESIGLNCCITEMQAAIGLAQLSKYNKIKEKKLELVDYYKKALSQIPEIEFQENLLHCKPVPWFTNIFVPNAEALQEHLKKNEIQTRRLFYPLHLQPCYKDLNIPQDAFPNSISAYQKGLSLPSGVNLTQDQLQKIANTIKEFYKK